MLKEARIQHLWTIAAQHRHGAGMENGLDLTLTTKHYHWYIKQGKVSQACAPLAVYTGALWPADRLESSDNVYKCLFCQQAGYDEIHLFYTCLKLITSRHPMIQQAQQLVE
eukprot:10291029-Karenia_brevis.AAC.1